MKIDWHVFFASVFFVLGFSFVFALAGVLLQTTLSTISYGVRQWMARLGGAIIVLFGIFLLGVINIPWLNREHKLTVKKKFKSAYLTSFLFGAAFGVGWTPCFGAILGAILTLAAVHPSNAFGLLFAYALGLGLPFLVVGGFTSVAEKFIHVHTAKMKNVTKFFGVILIVAGIILMFNLTERIVLLFGIPSVGWANADLFLTHASLGYGVAFLAGLVSFLSPCILPIVPAFVTYLGSLVLKK